MVRTDALPGRPYQPRPGRTGLLDARALQSGRDGWEHCLWPSSEEKKIENRKKKAYHIQKIPAGCPEAKYKASRKGTCEHSRRQPFRLGLQTNKKATLAKYHNYKERRFLLHMPLTTRKIHSTTLHTKPDYGNHVSQVNKDEESQ